MIKALMIFVQNQMNEKLKSNGPPMRLCERKSKFETHDPFS